MYICCGKRFFDILGALILLVLFSPILFLMTIALSIINKGTPFFMQERPGKEGKIFKIIKYKTMTDKKNDSGVLLPDSDRLTHIGRFVRKTSLDEILQLINVLKGDMSLVGPRPLSVKYLPLYSSKQKLRHKVKPGITGWAQINGRNNISWTKKIEYDVYYAENLSLTLDLKIFFLTFWKVINKADVNEGGTESIESFNGYN